MEELKDKKDENKEKREKSQKKEVKENREEKKEEVIAEETLEKQIFKKSSTTPRTPPKSDDGEMKTKKEEQERKPVQRAIFGFCKARASSLDVTTSQGREVLKRRREEEEDATSKDLKQRMEDMRKAVKELSELTDFYTYTKVKIKRAAKRLIWQMERLAHEWKEDRKEYVIIGTQTEGPCSVLGKKEKKSRILAALEKEEGFNKISEFLADRWPDQAYRRW